MDATLKQQLHRLINECDNEILLQQIKNLLHPEEIKNWWDELMEEDTNGTITPEELPEPGDLITHAVLQKQVEVAKLFKQTR